MSKMIHIHFFLFFLFLYSPEVDATCNRVYLATYPRSGNFWVRYLIEEATHQVTGSVYIDKQYTRPFHIEGYGWINQHGFYGESKIPQTDDPFVIKTHFPALIPGCYDMQPFSKVIKIVRHPIDSFYSFYLYYYSPLLKKKNPQMPRDELEWSVAALQHFESYWEMQPNVTTVRYEDLCQDPTGNLRLILDIIGYHVSDVDIERAVRKHPPDQHHLKHLKHYSQDGLEFIQESLGDYLQKYGYELGALEDCF